MVVYGNDRVINGFVSIFSFVKLCFYIFEGNIINKNNIIKENEDFEYSK